MWHTKQAKEVILSLNSNSSSGLSNTEVAARKKKFGENKITDSKKESLFMKFIKQFNDYMVIILIISAIISAITS